MTWLEEIIKAFENLEGKARYPILYKYIKQNTSRKKLPKNWKSTVRQTIQDHSKDSSFISKLKNNQALSEYSLM